MLRAKHVPLQELRTQLAKSPLPECTSSRRLPLHNRIYQRPDPIDADLDFVVGQQREGAVGDDAGAGKEERAAGEGVVAAQPADDVFVGAGHLVDAGLAAERFLAVAVDDEM